MSEKITVLRVGAKRNGYRRAGLQFGETVAPIPLATLTSHQVKELRTDRMLATETADAFLLSEREYEELRRKEVIANAFVASLPSDFSWTESPVEYVASLHEQIRVQTERATELQTQLDAHTASGATKHTGRR